MHFQYKTITCFLATSIVLYHVTVFSFLFYSKVFEGGSGNVSVTLEPVVQVRFVRFYPVSGDKCVKLELQGCSSIKGESEY